MTNSPIIPLFYSDVGSLIMTQKLPFTEYLTEVEDNIYVSCNSYDIFPITQIWPTETQVK